MARFGVSIVVDEDVDHRPGCERAVLEELEHRVVLSVGGGWINSGQSGIVVQPAGAASLVVAGFPTADTAGVANSFTVTAYDLYGNIATGYTGTVHFTSSDQQAGLPANYTFTTGTGDDDGVHTFSAVLKTAGTQYLEGHRHHDVEHHGQRDRHHRPARRSGVAGGRPGFRAR